MTFGVRVVTSGGGTQEVEYTPVIGTDVLPPYLQEAIAFDVDQAPVFLTKVITSTHPEEEEEEEEDDTDE